MKFRPRKIVRVRARIRADPRPRADQPWSAASCLYWRIHEGLAAQLLDSKIKQSTLLNSLGAVVIRISYADDENFIIGVRKNTPQLLVKLIFFEIQELKDSAYESIGSQRNVKKTEFIGVDNITETTWLGYNLVLSQNNMVDGYPCPISFKPPSFRKDNKCVIRETRNLFIYMPSITARRAFYQTYIAPLVDRISVAVITLKDAEATKTASIQHEFLCMVAKMPLSTSELLLSHQLNIKSIPERRKTWLKKKLQLTHIPEIHPDQMRTTRSGSSFQPTCFEQHLLKTYQKTCRDVAARLEHIETSTTQQITHFNPRTFKKWRKEYRKNQRHITFRPSCRQKRNAGRKKRQQPPGS